MKEIVNKAEVKSARQADLGRYLLSKGIPLVRNGRRYRHKVHDSLVITGNAYFWNSKQEHGNAIDFLIRYCDMDFVTAVKELSGITQANTSTERACFDFSQIQLDTKMDNVIRYLHKYRGIRMDLIQWLIDQKLLFQSKQNKNIIFPIRNERSEVVGAEIVGTHNYTRFKGIAKNSAYGYGFNIRIGEMKDIKNYFFMESAIDLLSFIQLDSKNSDLQKYINSIFVSMGGLKMNVFQNTLNLAQCKDPPEINLCIDTDKAGNTFCEQVSKTFLNTKVLRPQKEFKDWNEQLTCR